MKKVDYLDGVRGAAALMVVLHHYSNAFLPAIYTGRTELSHSYIELLFYHTPLHFFFSGNFAVCLFFILSGYVLSYKFFRTGDIAVLRSAAVRRYLRLAIPILGSVVISYILLSNTLIFNTQVASITHSDWLGRLWRLTPSVGSMLFAGVYGVLFNGDSGYNTSLWMMQIEFFGSFLTFGFLALFGRLSRRYIWYVTGLIVLFNTYYLAFLLGIILCDYSKFLNSAKYHEWYVRLSMISVCIVGVILSAYPIMAGETGILPLYFAFSFLSSVQAIISAHILGAFLLLLALFYFPFLQGLFRIRILLFLGSISFSLYLLHALILGSLSSYLFLVFNSHFSYFVSVMLMIVLSVPVLLGSAYLYSRYIDSFAQRIALWFYAHFFSS